MICDICKKSVSSYTTVTYGKGGKGAARKRATLCSKHDRLGPVVSAVGALTGHLTAKIDALRYDGRFKMADVDNVLRSQGLL